MTLQHPAAAPQAPALVTPLPRVLRPQRALPAESVRPTRAEVNLAHLRHNFRVLSRHAGEAEVWCVLKADAYGHGSKAVARTLERAGAPGVSVALLEEAVELRQAGLRIPILVMGGHFGDAWGEVLRHRLTPVLHDPAQVEALAAEVRFTGSEPCEIHFKVDTGMARLGIRPEELPAVAQCLHRHPEVRLAGLMTHFACAEEGDGGAVALQLARFDAATAVLRRLGVDPGVRHAANSAALLLSPRSRLDRVRPGLALFGVSPARAAPAPELRPVLRVRSELIAVREIAEGEGVGYGWTWRAPRRSRIATLPMGYADGLPRGLSGKGEVLVRGRRAPLVGTVSMDLAMVDVTEVDGVRPGDECVVLGSQQGPHGQDTITAEELAAHLGTIAWEVLTGISRRVPRFYREP